MGYEKARTIKRSVCSCGFPALDDSVPVGKEYIIFPESIRTMTWGCGGCGKFQEMKVVAVDPAGYMPLSLFSREKDTEEEKENIAAG